MAPGLCGLLANSSSPMAPTMPRPLVNTCRPLPAHGKKRSPSCQYGVGPGKSGEIAWWPRASRPEPAQVPGSGPKPLGTGWAGIRRAKRAENRALTKGRSHCYSTDGFKHEPGLKAQPTTTGELGARFDASNRPRCNRVADGRVTRPTRHLHLVVPSDPDYGLHCRVRMMSSDGVVLISISGEVDMETGPKIVAAVNAALERRPSSIFIDLAQVTFFGVAGATALLGARQKCERSSVNFTILRPSRLALFVLGLTGLIDRRIYLLNAERQRGGGQRAPLPLVSRVRPKAQFGCGPFR